MKLNETFADRFWSKVEVGEGCWVWTGSRLRLGYGRIYSGVSNVVVQAHRASYEIHHGPIPDGMFVMHTCDNPPCVNPTHLRLGTPLENHGDMRAKGRARWQVAPVTHCPHGHEYTPENTSTSPGRGRSCRACHSFATSRSRRLRRGSTNTTETP